jgi:hypothetical protein
MNCNRHKIAPNDRPNGKFASMAPAGDRMMVAVEGNKKRQGVIMFGCRSALLRIYSIITGSVLLLTLCVVGLLLA